jgi:hypothetical protein
MTERAPTDHLVRTSELDAGEAMHIRHPLNPRSELFMTRLGDRTGLVHLGVSLARIPAGKEPHGPREAGRDRGAADVRLAREVTRSRASPDHATRSSVTTTAGTSTADHAKAIIATTSNRPTARSPRPSVDGSPPTSTR